MSDNERRNLADRIIKTMNYINVSGKENLDRLLGCIQAMETLRDDMPYEIDKLEIGTLNLGASEEETEK